MRTRLPILGASIQTSHGRGRMENRIFHLRLYTQSHYLRDKLFRRGQLRAQRINILRAHTEARQQMKRGLPRPWRDFFLSLRALFPGPRKQFLRKPRGPPYFPQGNNSSSRSPTHQRAGNRKDARQTSRYRSAWADHTDLAERRHCHSTGRRECVIHSTSGNEFIISRISAQLGSWQIGAQNTDFRIKAPHCLAQKEGNFLLESPMRHAFQVRNPIYR